MHCLLIRKVERAHVVSLVCAGAHLSPAAVWENTSARGEILTNGGWLGILSFLNYCTEWITTKGIFLVTIFFFNSKQWSLLLDFYSVILQYFYFIDVRSTFVSPARILYSHALTKSGNLYECSLIAQWLGGDAYRDLCIQSCSSVYRLLLLTYANVFSVLVLDRVL